MKKADYIDLITSKTTFFIDFSQKEYGKCFTPSEFKTHHDFMIAGITAVAMKDTDISPSDYKEILEAENIANIHFEQYINTRPL